MNRARHLPTVIRLTPSRSATSVLPQPSAALSTIRDRSASACALFGRRAHASNSDRSPSVNTNSSKTRFGTNPV